MLKFLLMFEEETPAPDNSTTWIMFAILGVLVVVMLVTSILQRKKQKKQAEEMSNNLVLGCIVTTIGGIVGTLVEIDEENGCYYIETGTYKDKHTLQIVKNAIFSVRSQRESESVEEITNEIK
jgi:preprotein translocase YajC subunit